jgi:hypothetical protein
VVNRKVVHMDMVLDEMARVDQGWFKKSQNQRGKVVKILKRRHMTIIICIIVLSFSLIQFWFF